MPEDTQVPLLFAKPRQNEEICRWLANPETLLAKLVEHLSVQTSQVDKSNFIVESPQQPGADERGKIWKKTSAPYAIGFFASGEWRLVYTIPPGLIYAMASNQNTPVGFRELSDAEISSVGLPTLSLGKWVQSRG